LTHKNPENATFLVVEPDHFKYEHKMAPGNWNTEDRKARVKAVADSKPSKGLFQWTSEVNVGFPHLTDSLGSWTTFNLVCGTDKQLKSMASQVFDISKDHKIAF
jgi:hypothetical protein